MLEKRGWEEVSAGEDIDNYLAQLDGTGESTEVIEEMRQKWQSCALRSPDDTESSEEMS